MLSDNFPLLWPSFKPKHIKDNIARTSVFFSHLQLVSIHLQQLSTINVFRIKFWDVLLHVESSQPLTDLLSRPQRHWTGRFIQGLRGWRCRMERTVRTIIAPRGFFVCLVNVSNNPLCLCPTSSEDWDRVWYGWEDLEEESTGGEVEEDV